MNKETYIQIRIDKTEKERILKKANYIGLTLSEYLRQLCIYGDVRNTPESVAIDLRKIGININQITRRLNGGSATKDQVLIELQILLEELKRINLR